MDEGKLLEWNVKPGDHVGRGDIIAVVDTSKAAVDIECWDEGIVHELLVQPDETVPVGTVLAILLAPGEAAPAPRASVDAPPAPIPVPAPLEETAPVTPAAPELASRRRASPAARRRAEELGIGQDAIRGSGPDGAVSLEDIEAAAAARAAGPASSGPAGRAESMRRAMAASMSRSKREIPHYYLGRTIPLGFAVAWLTAHNASRPVAERILMAALFIKAAALACRKHPAMNGFCRAGAFLPSATVHVGVAISMRDGGLISPAILNADRKDVAALMAGLRDLVGRARTGSLKSSEMSDPTITVTNLGETGAESVFGVIYPPQVALLGFGAVRERAWVEDGKLLAMPCANASLAGDHRVSSGHQGALFLAEIAGLLQQPETL